MIRLRQRVPRPERRPLIEREGLEQPALVGHGMGAKVAMTLALTAPYAVGALAVIEAAPITPLSPWIEQLRAATAAQARMRAAQRRWGLPARPAEPGIDARCNLPAIALSLYELCRFPPHLRHLSSPLELQVMVGGASEFVQPVDARVFQPMFPRTQLQVVPGAGHWLHEAPPPALLDCLRRWLGAGVPTLARSAVL